MAFTHKYTQTLATPEEQWSDNGVTSTADTITSVNTTVPANGAGANAVSIDFPAAGFQSMGLLSDTPCVVTLTGATVIDGVSTSTVTLTPGVIRRITAITGNVTAVSVGANTTGGGPAGVIKLSVLFNS
jgi:hypothetical protein